MRFLGNHRELTSAPKGPIPWLMSNVRAVALTLRHFDRNARAVARTLRHFERNVRAEARTLRSARALMSFFLFSILWAFAIALAAGCHSYHVDTTIENRTGEPIQLLEVDYPSASYGADSLAAGADFHYRIQVEGKGQLKVLYTTNEGKPVQITGPTLAEGEEGRLEVLLLPNGKAEFHPELSPAR
jgi:hypothetical protein